MLSASLIYQTESSNIMLSTMADVQLDYTYRVAAVPVLVARKSVFLSTVGQDFLLYISTPCAGKPNATEDRSLRFVQL